MDSTKKSNTLIFVFLGIIVIVVGIVIGFIINSNQKSEGFEYKIIYNDMYIPGGKDEIYIKDNKINITTTHYCSAVDCESTVEEKEYIFSKENARKLKNYIQKNFPKDEVELDSDRAKESQKSLITWLKAGQNLFELYIEEFEYRIEYLDSDELSYHIYFKKDGTIFVKKATAKDYEIINIETYQIKFKKENMKKLKDFVKELSKTYNTKTIVVSSSTRKDEADIYKSIIDNDEKYLENDNNVKLLYSISYNGIDCETPVLYLYDDHTYEFFYTFGINGEKITPSKGTWDYDMNKLLNNLDKYKEDPLGPYTIRDGSGKVYTTYSTNAELKELTSSLDVKLEKCLEQE